MGQSWVYRVFRTGGLSDSIRSQHRQEGLTLIEEGLGGWIILKNFKSPGRVSTYRRTYIVGSLVLTEKRFVAYQWQKPIVNVPLEREWLDKIHCAVRPRGGIEIAFAASDFNSRHSGDVTVTMSSDKARVFIDRLYGSVR